MVNWSAQQMALFHWVKTGSGSCVLEAVAGAGKSSTLIEALGYMTGSVYLGAFNKRIAVELKEKATKSGIDMNRKFVGTMHSAGFSAWKRSLSAEDAQALQVSDTKTRDICEAMGVADDLVKFICSMVGYGKQRLIKAGDVQHAEVFPQWLEIVDHFGADSDLPEGYDINIALDTVLLVYLKSHNSCRTIIDFDDMIYAPLAYNCRFFQNDWVLLDEAQDTNLGRRLMARKMLKPNGRLIAVGDRHQAIYGFTGADSNSLDLIAREFRATYLPLTVTYRCPQTVVREAQKYVSHIEASETAPEGYVGYVPAKQQRVSVADMSHRTPVVDLIPWYVAGEPPAPTDAILCRFTKPLVQTAYGMIANGLACRVEGRDIGKGLIDLALRWKVRSIDALDTKLDAYYKREVAKAILKRRDSIRQSAEDKIETLRIFMARCRSTGQNTVDCVVANIRDLFADDVKGVTVLSTIHKAKGREWPTVYWLQVQDQQRELKDWEIQSEINCKYVAVTRAQETLIYVQGA